MPQELDPGQLECDKEHDGHTGHHAPERAAGGGLFRQNGQDEHAEQRAVIERAVAVHHLDERALIG